MTQRLPPPPGIVVQISVLEDIVRDAQRVIAVGVFRYLLRQHHDTGQSLVPCSSFVPKLCIEVSRKHHGFVSFNLSQGITSFFHELRLQCTWFWSVCLYQTNFNLNMPTLPPSGIHSSTQFANWVLNKYQHAFISMPIPAWANCADSTP